MKLFICTALSTVLLSGCTDVGKEPPTHDAAVKFCAEHGNLPVYPSLVFFRIQKRSPHKYELRASDDLAKVDAWYRQAFAKDGWQVWKERGANHDNNHPYQRYLMEKGDKRIILTLEDWNKSRSTGVLISPSPDNISQETFDLLKEPTK